MSASIVSSKETTTLLSATEECRSVVLSKLKTLHTLLNEAKARQAIEDHELNVSLQAPISSFNFHCEIDLEINNLPHHFTKLWLRGEPDEVFLRATHPALVKLRQDQVPRWKKSSRWNKFAGCVAPCRNPPIGQLHPCLLPTKNEWRQLCQVYISSCDWYHELLTETECEEAQAEMYRYQHLGLTPTTSEQWTQIALILAICTVTMTCLDWLEPAQSSQFSKKRLDRINNWCDLAVMSLHQADFNQNPTTASLRVIILLTSIILFETNYELVARSPQILKLHRLAIDASERLRLDRDPPAHFSPQEKDDRRRIWWVLVIIDAVFCSTGLSPRGLVGLKNSDTKYPVAFKSEAVPAHSAEKPTYLNLRSPHSRFEVSKFRNLASQLLVQRRPWATLSDIWKLDKDIIAMEASVLPEQRLNSDLDVINLSRRPFELLWSRDNELRMSQHIFYTAFWFLRSVIHRGLLYSKQPSDINVDVHRDIVMQCSFRILQLHRYIKLPTGLTSVVASAALTVSLELTHQPSRVFDCEIRTMVLECLSRLQTYASPAICRACQVIEHFFEPIRPHVEVSNNRIEAVPNKRQKIKPPVIFAEDSSDAADKLNSPSVNVAEPHREASGEFNEASKAKGSARRPNNRNAEARSAHSSPNLTAEEIIEL